MPVEDLTVYPGSVGETPFELYTARRDVWDYHQNYGMPAIIKRAYNSDHIGFGEGPHGEDVERDETYDDAYGQGFFTETAAKVGNQNRSGYSDGWLTYVTLDDTNVEASKPGARGAHKEIITQGQLPWAPNIWDDDLLILVQIQRIGGAIEITGTDDRFIIQGVTPVTMRGFFERYRQQTEANYIQDKQRFIAQKFTAVRMPRYNSVYDIPILGYGY